mmetsp:Transcript_12703/g.54550  ORF Transcript_12703/g.54550 Transcript_12703/m.54550 type:complete len:245 (+) Transcript_12703:153-887(+)
MSATKSHPRTMPRLGVLAGRGRRVAVPGAAREPAAGRAGGPPAVQVPGDVPDVPVPLPLEALVVREGVHPGGRTPRARRDVRAPEPSPARPGDGDARRPHPRGALPVARPPRGGIVLGRGAARADARARANPTRPKPRAQLRRPVPGSLVARAAHPGVLRLLPQAPALSEQRPASQRRPAGDAYALVDARRRTRVGRRARARQDASGRFWKVYGRRRRADAQRPGRRARGGGVGRAAGRGRPGR